MKKKRFKYICFIGIISVLSILTCSCSQFSGLNDNRNYWITNVNIYKDTPAWELALAVEAQKINKIGKIVIEQPALLNYQDPNYGVTPLMWAVGMEKYRSAETLLKCGADPNIASIHYKTFWGESPLFLASGYSWVDSDAKKDPKFVKLLLSYGADPNWSFVESEDPDRNSVIETGTTPLMNSIGCGIEKTKALVELGADINRKTKSGSTAADIALLCGWNKTLDWAKYAHYLIVEKNAIVTEPSYRRFNYGNEDPNDEFYPITTLRLWVCDLNSEKYKLKMEIVEEFARQGVDYWETPIHKNTLMQIKKLYPDTWEEYIKSY